MKVKSDFYLGMKHILPITLATMLFGMSVGMESHAVGLSFMEAVLMSVLVFAGSAQVVVLKLLIGTKSIITLGLAPLLVNVRHIPMGIAISDLFRRISRRRMLASLFFLSDSAWSVTLVRFREGKATHPYFLGAGVTAYFAWVLSTAVGYLLGGAILSPRSVGLDFVMTAIFLHMIIGAWKVQKRLLPWLVAGASAVVSSRFLPGTGYVLVGALAGALCGSRLDRPERSQSLGMRYVDSK